MTEENKREILEILQRTVGSSELSGKTVLTEAGFDSIKFIQFIVSFEEKYDVEVYDSDLLMSNFQTLEMVYETLDKYLQTGGDQKLYKCVITDCDGVLWRGIAGEDGADRPVVADGSAALQKALKSLREHGVYVCICTKNSSDNISAVLDDASLLEFSDVTICETDILDKAEAVGRILSDLDISSNSAVFLDDSAYECGLVAALVPGMTVLQADYSDSSFIDELVSLFENVPEQTLDRTKLYREQKEREKIHISAANAEEYNRQLQTHISCFLAGAEDAERLAELSQRTNRFNLSGRRYTAEQIASFLEDDRYRLFALTASDIYGDMGLVAAAVVCGDTIENFMLSCRVFGRGFEDVLVEKVKSIYGSNLRGIFNVTEKNRAHSGFYTEAGIETLTDVG